MARTRASQLAKWTEKYGEAEAKRRLQKAKLKQREYSKAFYEGHRERVVGWVRRYQVERSPEKFEKHQATKVELRLDLIERKAGRSRPLFCEACGNPPAAKKRLCFDHCHANGHFRGWLCSPCNLALGLVKDDPERLIRLAAYLEFDRIKGAP